MQILGIIPARYSSSRLPGKPLIRIKGKSLIETVYSRVSNARLLSKVVVATDDLRIYDHVKSFGGEVVMTKTEHKTGTDRCAEAASKFENMEIVVNIQGDEPLIRGSQIDALIQYLLDNPTLQIATLAKKIGDTTTIFDPNSVKVVFNKVNEALYFSRSPIPFLRDTPKEQWLEKGQFFKHIGIYAYRQSTLQILSQLSQTTLEKYESLEQLRWLENRYTIGLNFTNLETRGIDTLDDLEK